MQAVDGILKHLVKQSSPGKLTFVGELLSGRSYSPKMVSNYLKSSGFYYYLYIFCLL